MDYEEPILLFFLDYLAVMGLLVFCAHGGACLFPRKAIKMKRTIDDE